MSGGREHGKVYGAKELVPAFEIFDAVSRGTAEMGHGASYYWKGKSEAAQFFAAVPFGLTADEMNTWLYHGGGMDLWRQVYEPFGLVPTAAGNTDVQVRRFPDDVLKKLHTISDQVVAEIADKDPMSKKIYESFRSFREQVVAWDRVSEKAYLEVGAL